MSIADFIQMAQSNVTLLGLAVLVSIGSQLFFRWLDKRSAKAELVAHAQEAANEAAIKLRIQNSQDQQEYQDRLAKRITELEERNDRANEDCQKQLHQMQLDMESDKAAIRAENAAVSAASQTQHSTQLAEVFAENAIYKAKVASLEADNTHLWEQLHLLLDSNRKAGEALQGAARPTFNVDKPTN